MKTRNAFTLIETLVVVVIIALLLTILLPTLGKAREQTRRAVCQSNLHQIGVAVIEYAEDNQGMSPRLKVWDIKLYEENRENEQEVYGCAGWFPDPQYGAAAVYGNAWPGPVGLGLLVPEYVSVGSGRVFYCPIQSDGSHLYDQPAVGWHQWGKSDGVVIISYFSRPSARIQGPIRALAADLFYAGANRTGHVNPYGDYLCYSDGSVQWIPEEGPLWQSSYYYPSQNVDVRYVWDYFDSEYTSHGPLQ
ncbi:MAG: DUF1559 domain-containing protein [Phycisphaeraceae bacterium]|nr:DUF1559 domain-containing protein [Phycisphaeraceae bacterium]